MTVSSAPCDAYFRDAFHKQFLHGSTGDVFKAALYLVTAELSRNTTSYSTSGELSASGYTPGGVTIGSASGVVSGGLVILDWDNPVWDPLTASGIRAVGVFNTTVSGAAAFVIDIGGDTSVSAGRLEVQFPNPDSSSAIVRF